MHHRIVSSTILLAVWILLTVPDMFAQQTPVRDPAEIHLDQIPLQFEPNQGQADANVRFLSRSGSYAILLESCKTVLVVPPKRGLHDDAEQQPSTVTFELLHANPNASSEGVDLLPGKSNYFVGNRQGRWISGIPQYRKVKFKSVYPGTDVIYYGGDGGLEYDFVLSPGSDPQKVVFRVSGVDRVELDDKGNISLRLGDGTIGLREPTIYQLIAGVRHQVRGHFVLHARNEVGLSIGDYDHRRALVVDPVLSYSTLIGANNSTQIQGVAVDPSGEVLITGTTFATNYPAVNPFQSTNRGSTNIFVTKLNPGGNTILYSTYIGSSGFDSGRAIAVDGSGSAYITGNIGAADFPTTQGAFMTSCPGVCNTPFVSKFLSDGSLAFSTFMGGSNVAAWAIAVDALGSAYITGTAASSDLPMVNPFQTTPAGAFAQKLDPTGDALEYSTYLGGGGDSGRGITVDSSGSAYLVGNTSATNFPLKNPIQSSLVGGPNAFITKFSPDGASLVFSTYLGGSSPYFFSYAGDFATGIAVDSFGNVHVVGTSSSCEFPLTLNAWSTDCVSGGYTQKVFVTTLNPSGTQLLFATFLENGFSEGIAVDAKGNTYVTGIATLNNFPLLHAIEGKQRPGASAPFGSNSFLTELDLAGKILFSTYLGQTGGGAQTSGIAVDSKGGMYIAGAGQGDFPLLHPIPSQILQSTYYTSFLAKISPSNIPRLSLSPRVSPILALRNVSSVPVSISSITPSANFTTGGDCGGTLAPGTACTLLLIGKADNKRSGTVTIMSGASTNPQTFTIYKSPLGDSVGANLSISPMYVQFPSQLIGSSSGPRKVVVTNSGALPAAINSIFMIQPAAFTEINDCPGLLQPFSYCTITVNYDAATASDSAQLGILHDPNQTRDTVFLNGLGSSSAILASTPSVNFGTQFVGTLPLGRVVNITNTTPYTTSITGISSSSGFTQSNTCTAPLAPRKSCRVSVTYIPSINENATGSLTIGGMGPGSPTSVSLYGTGLVVSDLAFSPMPLNLYATVDEPAVSDVITLTNTSHSAITLFGFKVSGPFSQKHNCNGSLAAGASCTVTVAFQPTQSGTFKGSISISNSGPNSPQTMPVIGIAQTQLSISPTTVDFGQQKLNILVPGYFGIGNGQNYSTVTLSSVTVQGADFSLPSNPCPLSYPPFSGCGAWKVNFTPSQTGVRHGTVTVMASDSSLPHVIKLQGVGVSNGLGTLSNASFDFGAQSIGTQSQSQPVTLTNTGSGVLKIAGIAASQQFMQSSNCGLSLGAGANCTILIWFAPTLKGILEGTVSIQDDGLGSPHTITLTGIGQ